MTKHKNFKLLLDNMALKDLKLMGLLMIGSTFIITVAVTGTIYLQWWLRSLQEDEELDTEGIDQ